MVEIAYDSPVGMEWSCEYFSSFLLAGGKKFYMVREKGSYNGAYNVDVDRVASVVAMAVRDTLHAQ